MSNEKPSTNSTGLPSSAPTNGGTEDDLPVSARPVKYQKAVLVRQRGGDRSFLLEGAKRWNGGMEWNGTTHVIFLVNGVWVQSTSKLYTEDREEGLIEVEIIPPGQIITPAAAILFFAEHGLSLPEQLETFQLATDQFVTLDQAAASVSRNKRTLERYRYDKAYQRRFKMPEPDVEGGAGSPHQWRWSKLRPWLQEQFGRKLPERFFGQ